MREYEHLIDRSEETSSNKLAGPDGITTVLTALQGLAERTSHPVVRACLEQAYDDIVHLTSSNDDSHDDDESPVADDS